MTKSNSEIKPGGDIGFLFSEKHISLKWAPGDCVLLNQEFINKYQLNPAYGRIISRCTPDVKVEILKLHKELHLVKGKIVSLPLKTISENYLVSQGYIRIIFEELQPLKEVAEEDKINARLLKPGGNRAEHEGSIIRISADEAERLLDGGFIKILPDDYVEPIIPLPVYKESEWASIICKKAHPEYSYSPGGTGKILKKQLKKLLEGGYFDLSSSYSFKERAQILNELEFQKDPANNK